ncbi:MAG: RDD family protein [Lacisediminihabitans sp.]
MPPSFGRRLLAILIDYALIVAYLAVLTLVAVVVAGMTGGFAHWLAFGTLGAELLGFVTLVLPVGIYLYAAEASVWQATVGKRALRLRVIDETNGGRPGRIRILVRTVVKLIPWELAHFFVWQAVAAGSLSVFPVWVSVGIAGANLLPIAYVVCVLLQRERRGPHDLVAGTRVVSVRRGKRLG